MNNISMTQALSVWGDLWQAYYKDNPYGTDTAEIYAYRLMPHSPALLMPPETALHKEELHELARLAACSMRALVWMFCQEAHCRCSVDGVDCDTWLARNPEFDHRCHVKVIRK